MADSRVSKFKFLLFFVAVKMMVGGGGGGGGENGLYWIDLWANGGKQDCAHVVHTR